MIRWLSAGAFLLAVGFSLADTPPGNTQADALIAKILKVGREGNGNSEAASAWKSLVKLGTPALPSLLRGMNDDNLIGSNWLRTAFDAVAETALKENKLSKSDLESAISNQKLAGVARRLAYEWLVKVDSTAADRLLPTMLADASAELRREAVARVVGQAKAALEKKEPTSAKQLFVKALASAADPEQVESIAEALGKLGEKVDVASQLGAVRNWHVIAPFEHTKGSGWDVAYPPEKKIDLTASYTGKDNKKVKWVPYVTTSPDGKVDLNKALGKFKGAVAYAVATVDSPAERLVDLRAGCINGLKIFLNGKEIFAREEYHHGMRIDQYAVRATLQKGKNVILLKICQNEQKESWAQRWIFQLRICEPVGAGVVFTQAQLKESGE